MKTALKVRFHDVKDLVGFNPDVYEFHLSDKDLDYTFPNFKYDQELVVHCNEYWNRKLIDPASQGETGIINSREKSVEIIQKALDLTNKISANFKGKPMMVLHPGGMSLEPVEDKTKIYADLKKSLQELKLGNVILLVENMPPHPWFFGGQWFCNLLLDAKEIKEFLEDIHNPNIQLCYDLCHAQLYCNAKGKDINEEIKILNPFIKHIHISDAEGMDGEGLQIDEGKMDFVTIMNNIRRDVAITPEIWRGHEHNGAGFKTAFERLKKYE